MRIAFLCKRRYMGKDVIVDRYARLYEIPFQLARLGHQVEAFCLAYARADEGDWTHDARPGSLRWHASTVRASRPLQTLMHPAHILRQLRSFSPDVVFGASDIPHTAFAAWLSRRLDVPLAIDLYDNFEGFGQARLPGMKGALRRSVRHAALVSTTSEPLTRLVLEGYRARGDVFTMPSTIDRAIFHPRDRLECRRALGLPERARLLGTAGGLHADKGIGTLYAAWERLSCEDPSLHLVLAGPADPRCPPPQGDRVHYLGSLPHERIAMLFAALDVGVIYLRDTPFGRYCFPQKAYEMHACGTPIVAGRVGAMAQLLQAAPQCLYEPDDVDSLAGRIVDQLREQSNPPIVIDDWSTVIGKLGARLATAVKAS